MGRTKAKAVKTIILCLIFIWLLAELGAVTAGVENPSFRQQYDHSAILLIIDVSGSMSRTDPDNLREASAKMVIDLAGHDDYFGVIAFDSEAETIIPFQQIEGSDNRQNLKEGLSGKLEPRRSTDFAAAFEEALTRMNNLTDDYVSSVEGAGLNPVIIFLTDGDPNPDPQRRDEPGFIEGYMETVWDLIRTYTIKDIPIYTVGFGEVEQPEILERISTETRGEAFYLRDSTELAVTFFDIISDLTNRTPLYRGKFGAGTEKQVFEFEIDDNTRQVNLLGVLTGEETASEEMGNGLLDGIRLMGPSGISEGIFDEVIVVTEENYTLLVVQNRPGENDNRGTWRLTHESSDQDSLNLFADIDNIVRAHVKSPTANSRYSLYEDVNIKVNLDGIEELSKIEDLSGKVVNEISPEDKEISEEQVGTDTADRDESEILMSEDSLRVEAVISRPGSSRRTYINLQEQDGYFVGIIPEMSEPGECVIKIRVYYHNELLTVTESKFYLVRSPKLVTDLHMKDIYPIGEEVTASAFMNMRGDRLVEGRTLEIDMFELVITNKEETDIVSTHPFNDDGIDGDIRKGDGFWTGKFQLTEKGYFTAHLFVRGKYQREEFMIDKELGEFTVAPPGQIIVAAEEGPFMGVLGRTAKIDFQITNDSMFKRELQFKSVPGAIQQVVNNKKVGGGAWHLDERIALSPGEERSLTLSLQVPNNLEEGIYTVPIQISAEEGLDILMKQGEEDLQNAIIEQVDIQAMSLMSSIYQKTEDFFKNGYFLVVIPLFFIGLAAMYLTVGILLYTKNIKPIVKLQGYLRYRSGLEQLDKQSARELYSGEIDLCKNHNNRFIIVLGSELNRAEQDPVSSKEENSRLYHLKNTKSNFNIIIQPEAISRNSSGFRLLGLLRVTAEGWESIKKDYQPPMITLKCTPPGVIKTPDGNFYSQMNLLNGDIFMAGGYMFHYVNEARAGLDEKIRGKNVLGE